MTGLLRKDLYYVKAAMALSFPAQNAALRWRELGLRRPAGK